VEIFDNHDGTVTVRRPGFMASIDVEHTIELPTHKDAIDFETAVKAWRDGQVIQAAMPWIRKEDREFLITGIKPDQWDEIVGEEEAEELDELDDANLDRRVPFLGVLGD